MSSIFAAVITLVLWRVLLLEIIIIKELHTVASKKHFPLGETLPVAF